MRSPVRLLVFGLAPATTPQDLHQVLGRCGDPALQLVVVPGDSDSILAVVHLAPDRGLAWRVARRVNTTPFHGRRLQCWVIALPWL